MPQNTDGQNYTTIMSRRSLEGPLWRNTGTVINLTVPEGMERQARQIVSSGFQRSRSSVLPNMDAIIEIMRQMNLSKKKGMSYLVSLQKLATLVQKGTRMTASTVQGIFQAWNEKRSIAFREDGAWYCTSERGKRIIETEQDRIELCIKQESRQITSRKYDQLVYADPTRIFSTGIDLKQQTIYTNSKEIERAVLKKYDLFVFSTKAMGFLTYRIDVYLDREENPLYVLQIVAKNGSVSGDPLMDWIRDSLLNVEIAKILAVNPQKLERGSPPAKTLHQLKKLILFFYQKLQDNDQEGMNFYTAFPYLIY